MDFDMKIKTNEATGPALDWMVAKCEGLTAEHGWTAVEIFNAERVGEGRHYSTDWAQGGPIIERELIDIQPLGNQYNGVQWRACGGWISPTPLIAAMRCYVASRLGDEVEVPNELL